MLAEVYWNSKIIEWTWKQQQPPTNQQPKTTNNQQQQPVATTMKGTDLSSLHCGPRLRHFGGGADGHGGWKQGGGSWTYHIFFSFFSNLILLFGDFCDQIHDSPKKVSFPMAEICQ